MLMDGSQEGNSGVDGLPDISGESLRCVFDCVLHVSACIIRVCMCLIPSEHVRADLEENSVYRASRGWRPLK